MQWETGCSTDNLLAAARLFIADDELQHIA